MPRVLITDGLVRKTLSIVRSLGRRGIEVTVGDITSISISSYSKYCTHSFAYPPPKRDPQGFIDFLLSFLKEDSYDVLFPMDMDAILLVAKHLEEFSKHTKVPIPSYETILRANNKVEVLRLAEEIGIPCPNTYFVEDISEVVKAKDEIGYPMVIKPRDVFGSLGVTYVKEGEDLLEKYLGVHHRHPFPMVQEYIPYGGAYGVSALLNSSGEVRASFVHKRLREYPVKGGPSTLREGVHYPELEEMGLRLLKHLKWHGVANVEFRADARDGIPKLMEVNPRFWGSVELAIVSGIDFPWLLYRMAVDGDVEPVKDYKVGLRCRWFFPGDIMHFIENPNRFRMEPSFFNFWDRNTYYDILSIKDPLPVVGAILCAFPLLFNRDIWRAVRRR